MKGRRFVTVAALLALGACAHADEAPPVAQKEAPAVLFAGDPGGNWVRIHNEPCPAATGWLRKMRRAELWYEGKPYRACWWQDGPRVLILDEQLDLSPLPLHAFRKDEVL